MGFHFRKTGTSAGKKSGGHLAVKRLQGADEEGAAAMGWAVFEDWQGRFQGAYGVDPWATKGFGCSRRDLPLSLSRGLGTTLQFHGQEETA